MASAGAPDAPRTVRLRRFAIQGCCHGDLDQIYATVADLERAGGRKIDAVLICGDFQAVRNADDLECLACPPKYRALKDFHAYYAGAKRAPYLTIFIGGNHEASNHLAELALGGWAAPNIYYVGHAGAVTVHGVRVAGLSGIYKAQHYALPRTEAPPYGPDALRSAYHVRALDAHRLARLTGPIDVFLSHDWPAGIARHGDVGALLARKPFLRSEIADGSLGSPPAAALLAALRPAHWFSAHLHTKFAAVVDHHGDGADGGVPCPGAGTFRVNPVAFAATRFLALDKCLPGRAFLQVVDVAPSVPGAPPGLGYDAQWCAILKATAGLERAGAGQLPADPVPPSDADVAAIASALTTAHDGSLAVPCNFEVTAPPPPPGEDTRGRHARGRMPTRLRRNPQTVHLCEVLGMEYALPEGGQRLPPPPPPPRSAADAIFDAAARVAAAGGAPVAAAGDDGVDGGGGGGVAVIDPNAIDLDGL